jgi:hypothetical protein
MHNSGDNDNGKKSQSNIGCDVSNCHYHNGDQHCTAKKINVGPSYASTTQDTICSTFKQR